MFNRVLLAFFIYYSTSFAITNFISDYDIIDIRPMDTKSNVIIIPVITNRVVTNKRVDTNTKSTNKMPKEYKHSLGLDFGTAIYSMISAPLAVNLSFEQKDGSHDNALSGKFGFRFTYNYNLFKKIDIDATLGVYMLSAAYTNSKSFFNSDVYAIPFSLGIRFYFNKHGNSSGFFLLPKIGGTLFFTKGLLYKGNEYIEGLLAYNRDTFVFDRYLSLELGFRIDISRSLGIDSGPRPFFDISILDIGFSYISIFRIVPLPRLAIGILF